MRRFFVLVLLVSSPLFAGPKRIKIENWSVPRSTTGVISGRATFVAVAPCRVVDTRNPNGPYGGPYLSAGMTRTFNIPGSPCAGIPIAAAYSLNFTIVNYDVNSAGWVTAGPSGSVPSSVSTVNFGNGTNAVANAAIVPANGSGSIDVFAAGSTNLIIDINGYFTEPAITSVNAGSGISVTGTGDVTVAINTSGAAAGQALSFNGTSTLWSNFISSVTAGNGLSGGGTSGTVPLSVNFAGSGTANTAARSDHTHYVRTIIVSPGATQAASGTNLINAISGIVTGNPANAVLVKIEPGIYDIGGATINLPNYADIEGSGEDMTTIHGTGFGVLHLGHASTVRQLTVDGAQYTVEAFYVSSTMDHVTVKATYPTSATTAVYLTGSGTHTLNDVTIVLSGLGGTPLTVDQSGTLALSANLHHVNLVSTLNGSGSGAQMQGMQISGATIDAEDLRMSITASGTNNHILGLSGGVSGTVPSVIKVRGFAFKMTGESISDGIWATGGGSVDLADGTLDLTAGVGGAHGIWSYDSNLRLRNVVVNVTDASASATGLYNSSATAARTVIVQNSEVNALNNTVNTSGGNITVLISNSKLLGGPVLNGSIPTQCTYITDENMLPYTNTCP